MAPWMRSSTIHLRSGTQAARLVTHGRRSHEQGLGLVRRRRLDHFAQLGFLLCGRCLLLLGRHTPSAASSGTALWRHPLCNRACSASCQSGACGKLAWHWAALHSRRGRGWCFTAPQLLDSAYVAAELRSLRTRLKLAGNLWWCAALLRLSCHRWLDERSREKSARPFAPLN